MTEVILILIKVLGQQIFLISVTQHNLFQTLICSFPRQTANFIYSAFKLRQSKFSRMHQNYYLILTVTYRSNGPGV